ncbi:MAG: serine/threonine protein kinase, partial [Planctomycetaceae bacterium]|nr:serine/threonine protein kinase [Planctomycetaceae bacterium]
MPSNPGNKPDPLEKSLGDQATGADVSRVDRDMSLGDQSTTGDALSSLTDLGSGLGEAIDSDLRLIDLEANFQIEGELGQGGMGAVLLATDRQLKRKVAIKRILGSMSKSKTALQRFVTEAQSIAALNHFNIVQVYEFGRDAEGPLLVLEYVGGGSLLDKLKDGKLEVEEAVDITCQLCDALAKAHGAGIIHR